MFLLTAVSRNPSSEEIERLWRTYYHFYVTSADLVFVQQHCQKLLTASESLSTWNDSPFGLSLKFSTEASLSEVRRIWSLYSQTRSEQEDAEARRAIKIMYKENRMVNHERAFVSHSVRSAGAHSTFVAPSLSKAFHNFWQTGVVAGNDQDLAMLNQDDGGRVNPLMTVSSLGSFNVHYGLDPFTSFHLAEGFDLAQTADATTNSLARLAKSQFSGWCHVFASSVASRSININYHCGDAVNLSHALQAIRGSATLPSFTYLYTKPWSAVPLELPSDMITNYDVIDTSNVMDHVGLLNLLSATAPLLSGRRDAVLYTESLLQGAEESEKLLETLLHSSVTMSSLLFGITPVGYLLGTMTDSTHHEQLLDMSTHLTQGIQKQYRMRIPWKRAAQGDGSVPSVQSLPYRLEMDPHELASLFMHTYLAMFRERENMSTVMQMTERKQIRPLVGDLGFHTRLSLVALLASARRNISTDWLVCVTALVRRIAEDKVLMVGPSSLQELYMHLHLSGLWQAPKFGGDPREQESYYGGPRPAGEPGFLGQQSLPSTVNVALVVPRSSLADFRDPEIDQIGPVGLYLSLRTRDIDNCFHAIDVFFGRFESDDINTAIIAEDNSGWSGTSDMIVTCRVPTWGFLVGRREDFRVRLSFNYLQAGQSYISNLGSRLHIFSADLDSKNVRILAQAPCTKPRPVSRIEDARISESTGPPSATVSLNCDGTVQSIGVTKDLTPNAEAASALKDRDVVKIMQTSACVLTVSIVERKDTIEFIFPYPINSAAAKVNIIHGSSSTIEVKAPTSNAFQPGGFNLDPFPVVRQDLRPLAWGMSRVDPDIQPLVRISAPAPEFLGMLCMMTLSKGDLAQLRANPGPDSVSPMLELKQVIGRIFADCAGFHTDSPSGQIRMLTIEQDGVFRFHVIAKCLRHDRDAGSIFLDGFFVTETADFVKHMTTNRPKQKCGGFAASKEAMKLWLHLIPAVIERCRSWEHTSDCSLQAGSKQIALCDCGLGRDAEQMPSGYEDMAKFATRIALPLVSAVPYVESVVDDRMVSQMSAYIDSLNLEDKEETTHKDVCDNCGSDKPGLKACTRCGKVKYCNHTCRQAAWKKHKKDCKR